MVVRSRVAFFVPPSQGNVAGIERVMTNLASGISIYRKDWEIHLVLSERLEGLPQIDSAVRCKVLGTRRLRETILMLAWYLKTSRPDVMVIPQILATWVGLAARRIARYKARLISVIHGNVYVEARKSLLDRVLYTLAQYPYRHSVAAVVGVSHGLSKAMRTLTHLDTSMVRTIYNPVLTTEWCEGAEGSVDHPWFSDAVPVILGVGRLSKQKDFEMLMRAFALVHKKQHSRLVILGEGEECSHLEALAQSLGIVEDSALLGYVSHPGPYMRHAAVFVLSSRYEGLGNVLIEAMAVGTPVVSTDCPFGPTEILEEGRLGRLVSIGDERAMAEAILATLEQPPSDSKRNRLKERAEMFTLERAVQAYTELIEAVLQ